MLMPIKGDAEQRDTRSSLTGGTAMRLRMLTAWWRDRKTERGARVGFDATGEFERYTLLDEASKPSFRA